MSEHEYVKSASTIPTISVNGYTQKRHFRPLTEEWQNDILHTYYAGDFGDVEITEHINGSRHRSVTINGSSCSDTLHDHPPSAHSRVLPKCQHHKLSSLKEHESELPWDGRELTLSCKSCFRVFRHIRDLGYYGDNPDFEGIHLE